MCTYQDIDATVVRVVRQSLLQHLWYLTEQLLIPAFFMSAVPGLKEVMAATQVHLYPPIPDALKIS